MYLAKGETPATLLCNIVWNLIIAMHKYPNVSYRSHHDVVCWNCDVDFRLLIFSNLQLLVKVYNGYPFTQLPGGPDPTQILGYLLVLKELGNSTRPKRSLNLLSLVSLTKYTHRFGLVRHWFYSADLVIHLVELTHPKSDKSKVKTVESYRSFGLLENHTEVVHIIILRQYCRRLHLLIVWIFEIGLVVIGCCL